MVSLMKKQTSSKLDVALPLITAALVVGGAIFLGVLSGKTGGNSGDYITKINNSQAYFRGAENPKVALTEFSDFQCPACRTLSPVLKDLIEKYPDEVKLYFRHFPIFGHSESQKAAEAAESAGEQGKFWEMHDKIYENQENIGTENLKRFATELGLDMDRFNSALDSSKYQQKVLADRDEGLKLGVNATPTLFLNEGKLDPAEFGKLSDLVKEELAKNNE